jgi:hypothetical protein
VRVRRATVMGYGGSGDDGSDGGSDSSDGQSGLLGDAAAAADTDTGPPSVRSLFRGGRSNSNSDSNSNSNSNAGAGANANADTREPGQRVKRAESFVDVSLGGT